MKLNAQAKKIMENVAALNLPPAYSIPVNDARARLHKAFTSISEPEEIFKVENIKIPSTNFKLNVRVYTPSSDENLPCLLFFHGGGWTVNDLDTHDSLCRALSNQVDIVVVSVDYRLAPEHKFPCAIEDSLDAYYWVLDNAEALNIDKEKIGVGGDSSGGNQAAVLCQILRDRNAQLPIFQWLLYPVTDYYLPGTKSYIEMANGYSLNRDFMIWFWNNYLPNNIDVDNPYISPLRAKDFSKLPKAYIMTANFDPLRDEGELYSKKLKESGCEVRLKRYDDMMHGFILQRAKIDNAEKAFQDAVQILKEYFS